MSSRNESREVDGFPFPYQPSPLESNYVSRTTAEELPLETCSLSPPVTESRELPTEYSPPLALTPSSIRFAGYTFYPNDESAKTVVIRGGFGASKDSHDTSSNGMRCYPPLPNSAYGLTSQAYIPQDANVRFNVYTSTSTEADPEVDVNGMDMADSHSMRFRNVIGSSVVKYLDGSRDEVEVNTTIPKEEPEKKHNSINDFICNPPCRQPLTLTVRTRTKEHSKGEEPFTSAQAKTRGELLADTINFNRSTWVMTTPGISGDLYPAKEQRADYIKYIDGIDKEKWELDYCKLCKTKHIPPGPPITLEDRDTCGAYLPEWFPANEFDKPWFSFNRLINEMVKLEEILQGYSHKPNPDQPFWDLHFHEYSSKWRAISKRGGWWKCRDGEDATDVEGDCHICHNELVEKDRATDAARKCNSVAERLATIKEFIADRIKEVGERDKALALAQIRAEGYSQYIGPRTIEDEKFRNPELARTATVSTIRSHFSADGEPTPNEWGTPVRGRSPPRGHSPVRRGRE